uniref:Uncharacterized protein n=1 Tax=Anopheles culicifacies TaxID=139723 RepID=A0A182M3S8_9DIPT
MLTVECRVEEGNLHLAGVMDGPDVVNLDVVRGSITKHLGQTLNEASLHLGRNKLLVGDVERQFKQNTVVTFVRSFGSVSFVYTNVAKLGSWMLLRKSRTIMFEGVTSPSTSEMARAISICQSTLLANFLFRRSARLISWFRLRCQGPQRSDGDFEEQ